MARPPPLEQQLAALRALRALPVDDTLRSRLRAALASPDGPVVAAAARITHERALRELAPALREAFDRLAQGGPKRDPGCAAKFALLEALDALDHPDDAPFSVAARLVQLEPAWDGADDTAGALRARAAMALLNRRAPDALLVLGEQLADPVPLVRREAADTLGHAGEVAAPPLALKHRLGDKEPEVASAVASALLRAAPEHGLERLQADLRSKLATVRETAALALGASRHPDAVAAIVAWMENTLGAEREVGITALGVHRSPAARDALLELIVEGHRREAALAIEALGISRSEPGLRDKVADAVARSPHPLERSFVAVFGEGDPDEHRG